MFDVKSHLINEILAPWMRFALDRTHGGFYGHLDEDWKPNPEAAKGLVQHSRFLWTYSSAVRRYPDHPNVKDWRNVAEHARLFLEERFVDRESGGCFWSVSNRGAPLDNRKHIYPHSFYIYANAEYARAFANPSALTRALEVFNLLEAKAHDTTYLGYRESFDRDWNEIDQHEDMGMRGRRKSMNSHIHMLESVTVLAEACKEITSEIPALVLARLSELRELVCQRIFSRKRNSLDQFFERDWSRLPAKTSYGHDIETSWLLEDALQVGAVSDADRTTCALVCDSLAHNTLKGMQFSHGATRGGLAYEGNSHGEAIDPRRVWWPQAEALVGFSRAFHRSETTSRKNAYAEAHHKIADWIVTSQRDAERGDWFEEILEDGRAHSPKGHMWKDPYHQARACMEVIDRPVGAQQ